MPTINTSSQQKEEDAAILEDYLSRGGTAPIPDSQASADIQAQSTLDAYVNPDAKKDEVDGLAERKKILADKKLTLAEQKQALAEVQLREQEEARAQKEEAEKPTPSLGPPAFMAPALETASQNAQKATDWIASLPTPGGVLALVLALIFIVWVAVPVGQNGETRAYLLYLTLTGRTQLAGAQVLQPEFGPSLPLPTTLFAGGIIPGLGGNPLSPGPGNPGPKPPSGTPLTPLSASHPSNHTFQFS